MQGLIFTALAEMIEEKFGLLALQKVLDTATIEDDAFVSTSIYPDSSLVRLVEAASDVSGIAVPDLVKAYGEYLFAHFVKLHEAMILESESLKDFLLRIDSVIHVEVSKLYPGSSLPIFNYEDIDENNLVMIYRSPRKMCHLAEGLVLGAANYFNTPYQLTQTQCMHSGADHCRLEIQLNG